MRTPPPRRGRRESKDEEHPDVLDELGPNQKPGREREAGSEHRRRALLLNASQIEERGQGERAPGDGIGKDPSRLEREGRIDGGHREREKTSRVGAGETPSEKEAKEHREGVEAREHDAEALDVPRSDRVDKGVERPYTREIEKAAYRVEDRTERLPFSDPGRRLLEFLADGVVGPGVAEENGLRVARKEVDLDREAAGEKGQDRRDPEGPRKGGQGRSTLFKIESAVVLKMRSFSTAGM